jgi:hypothetical protein
MPMFGLPRRRGNRYWPTTMLRLQAGMRPFCAPILLAAAMIAAIPAGAQKPSRMADNPEAGLPSGDGAAFRQRMMSWSTSSPNHPRFRSRDPPQCSLGGWICRGFLRNSAHATIRSGRFRAPCGRRYSRAAGHADLCVRGRRGALRGERRRLWKHGRDRAPERHQDAICASFAHTRRRKIRSKTGADHRVDGLDRRSTAAICISRCAPMAPRSIPCPIWPTRHPISMKMSRRAPCGSRRPSRFDRLSRARMLRRKQAMP